MAILVYSMEEFVNLRYGRLAPFSEHSCDAQLSLAELHADLQCVDSLLKTKNVDDGGKQRIRPVANFFFCGAGKASNSTETGVEWMISKCSSRKISFRRLFANCSNVAK